MNATIRIAAVAAFCSGLSLTACMKSDKNTDAMSDATFDQVDRMGIPSLNTVFNHPKSVEGFSKTTFNQRGPESDLANYTAQFKTVLGAVANENPEATAKVLLPDVLPSKLASATSDFSKLDGRKLEDDAVDVALSVTVGPSLKSLHTDNVNANDVPFLAEFPYLAAPHQP